MDHVHMYILKHNQFHLKPEIRCVIRYLIVQACFKKEKKTTISLTIVLASISKWKVKKRHFRYISL